MGLNLPDFKDPAVLNRWAQDKEKRIELLEREVARLTKLVDLLVKKVGLP